MLLSKPTFPIKLLPPFQGSRMSLARYLCESRCQAGSEDGGHVPPKHHLTFNTLPGVNPHDLYSPRITLLLWHSSYYFIIIISIHCFVSSSPVPTSIPNLQHRWIPLEGVFVTFLSNTDSHIYDSNQWTGKQHHTSIMQYWNWIAVILQSSFHRNALADI
jgi:hypothetical protein